MCRRGVLAPVEWIEDEVRWRSLSLIEGVKRAVWLTLSGLRIERISNRRSRKRVLNAHDHDDFDLGIEDDGGSLERIDQGPFLPEGNDAPRDRTSASEVSRILAVRCRRTYNVELGGRTTIASPLCSSHEDDLGHLVPHQFREHGAEQRGVRESSSRDDGEASFFSFPARHGASCVGHGEDRVAAVGFCQLGGDHLVAGVVEAFDSSKTVGSMDLCRLGVV